MFMQNKLYIANVKKLIHENQTNNGGSKLTTFKINQWF